MIELVERKTSFAPCLSESFERYVEADLVSVLEGVSQGLGDAVDPYVLAFDVVAFDTRGERLAGEADDPERRITKARLTRTAIDRHPDFRWKLGSDPVEAQRREQADDTTWDGPSGNRQAMMFRDGSIRTTVLAASDPLELPCTDESGEGVRMDSGADHILRRDNILRRGKLYQSIAVGFQ